MSEWANEKKKRRIATKIGTAALCGQQGVPDEAIAAPLVADIAAAKKAGHPFLLVTSGAVGFGRRLLGYSEGCLPLRQKQVASKCGQAALMAFYEKLFAPHGIIVSQSLFERRHFGNDERAPMEDMVAPLFEEMKTDGLIPIINENDGVATRELRYTDNDELLSFNAGLIQADLAIILTNVRGVYTGPPSKPGSVFVPEINFSDPSVWSTIDTSGKSVAGLGGMKGKLRAACDFLCECGDERKRQWFLRAPCGGAEVVIASSREPHVIGRAMAGDSTVGTRCYCRPTTEASTYCRLWRQAHGYG